MQNLVIAKAKLQGPPVPASGEAGSCQALPMAGQVSPLRPGNKVMALKVLPSVSQDGCRERILALKPSGTLVYLASIGTSSSIDGISVLDH